MKNLPREFVGRTVRAILFIGLVVVFCTAISSAGLFLASRFGLTRSREQVPLTALSIGSQGDVTLPQRGKMVEGDGWKLRNSRDIYTLTLDSAVIEAGTSEDGPEPAVTVVGDLNIELREGSGNWIKSGGVGILAESGTLVIRGNAGAVIAADAGTGYPSLRIADKAAAVPQSAGIVQLKSPGIHKDSGAEYSVITFSAEGEVVYDEETGCFEGAEKEIVFMGK